MARRVEMEMGIALGTEIGTAMALDGPAGVATLGDLTAVDPLPILLVDDCIENLRALEAVLAPLGFPHRTATSGPAALRLLLEHEFAVILLDVRTPGIDGLQTARVIKSRPHARDVPIICLIGADDEVGAILGGDGVGAVDYVLKPFDGELLRSKVAVFASLESGRRALKRSEAFLRGAFEAAPIGKTVLDESGRIVRSNPAFARLLGCEPGALPGTVVADLAHPEDRSALSAVLDAVADGELVPAAPVDLRLKSSSGSDVWVAAVASSIEPAELGQFLLLVQWVDLTARRRAEQARAELLREQSARAQVEAVAERLEKLQTLARAIEGLSLDELLPALAVHLGELFGAETAEIRIDGGDGEPLVVRAAGGRVLGTVAEPAAPGSDLWVEAPLAIDRTSVGVARLGLGPGRRLHTAERVLFQDAAERAALSIFRARLHQREHRIAAELQRGLLPERLPEVQGIELAAHYEAAGVGARVGGDWYDAFPLAGGRIGVVVGDVAGRGIPAASLMGELRSVTRAFALGDDQERMPGDVLTRLNRYRLALGSEDLVTVLYAIVDPPEAVVWWANAGHPPPLLRSSSGETGFLQGGDGLVGIEDTVYHNFCEPIGRHGTLIMYTDGLIERRGESLDAGLDRLAGVAASGPKGSVALCEHILAGVLPAGSRRQDDVTAVLATIS